MSSALAQSLQAALLARQLAPQALAALNDDACAWTIDLGHGLQAELALQRTSWSDHQLTLVTATDSAHEPARWPELDLFAHEMDDLAAPCRLLRFETELGVSVQGRAEGASALGDLAAELVFLQRRTISLLLEPWVMLARGQCSIDEAGLRVGAAVVQGQGPIPDQLASQEGA
jgi:hypothetical protein